MLFSCGCLNARVEAVLDRPLEETLCNIDQLEKGPAFMRLVLRRDDFCNLRIDNSMNVQKLGDWTIRRCKLCQTVVYAFNDFHRNEILVGADMLHDEVTIAAAQRSQRYSNVFKVLLPAAGVEEQQLSGPNSVEDDEVLLNNAGVTHVRQTASNHLRRARDEMEERIRRYVDEENAKFDELRAQVKAERSLLERHLLNDDRDQSERSERSANASPTAVRSSLLDNPTAVDSVSLPTRALYHPMTSVTNARGSQGPKLDGLADIGNNDLEQQQQQFDGADVGGVCVSGKPKRVRHSGGTGKAPKLFGQALDSQEILFVMDDCEAIYAEPQMPADEGVESDASTVSGDGGNNVDDASEKTSALNRSSALSYGLSSSSASGDFCKAMGTSLPVTIPAMTSRMRPCQPSDSEEDDCLPDGNLVNSIHALALTMQEADAPERLFGERPSRHRYRGHRRHPMQ